uniref:EF-hand domain-containing protein n=1 Tax=Podarcis muralis TaxID=64176 RepID=A0A670IE86_PODMU
MELLLMFNLALRGNVGCQEGAVVNYRVIELDLSHNEFADKGGEQLGQMLANNESLEVLNLSWNHLRMKGAVALSAGLRANGALKVLNLSWNGFGNEGALALGEALKVNNVLNELDISSNHINNEGTLKLCKGLEVNGTLRILKMSHNPITVEGAIALVSCVRKNTSTKMEEINISNVLVNEGFIRLLDVVCDIRPELDVVYGGVGGHVAHKIPPRPDAMKLIQNYLDEHKLRLWDFFRNMDKYGNMKIPVAEFRRTMMLQKKIPLDRVQVVELVRKLDQSRTGYVDYRGLVDTRNQMVRDQRRQLRLEESQKKKEKHKNERVLQTFRSAVEVATPHSSMVISPSQKSVAQPEPDSPPPTRSSATPLSSWHYPAAVAGVSTSSQHSAGQAPSSSNPLSQSEPHSASRGMPASSLEVKFYSEPNLSCSEAPVRSHYNMATSELEVDSSIQPSDMAKSYRVMPVGNKHLPHRHHYQWAQEHNTVAKMQQRLRLKIAKKNR